MEEKGRREGGKIGEHEAEEEKGRREKVGEWGKKEVEKIEEEG